MKNLKIKIPQGFEVDDFDKATGEITFRAIPIDITERLKTMADVYAYHNTTEDDFMSSCVGLKEHEIGRRKEEMIVAAYNEGKFPDWTDGTAKGYPFFNMANPSGSGFSFLVIGCWFSYSFVGSRQVFVGPNWRKNLLDAVKKFLPEYQQSRTT